MKINKTLIYLFLFLPFILFADDKGEKDKAGKYISEGMTAYSTEDYTQAIELFEKAFILRPDYSALAYNISCCYALQHEKDSAITWLEKTIELGAYKFSDDEDFASLKEDKRFQELEKIAEQKIKELESKEWLPVIVLPEEFKEENQYPSIIALHGFGGNPVNLSKTLEPGVSPLDFILCCPYGSEIRGSTSFSWGDYEISEKRILEALEFLKENYKIDTENIILLGYSQGGARVFYTGLKNPEVFSAIITVAASYGRDDKIFDDSLEHEKVKDTKIYMMVGGKDRSLESNKWIEKTVKEKGISVRFVVFPELGHGFPPNSKEEIQKALTWIVEDK